jgi:hypothetical protein
VLYGISESYNRFLAKHRSFNENFKHAHIFANPSTTRALNSKEPLSRLLFSHEFFYEHAHKLYKLRYSNFYTEANTIVPANEVFENMLIPLSELMIQTFRGACADMHTKYRKKVIDQQRTASIETLICRSNWGSKNFRKILDFKTMTDIPHNIKKFANNLDVVVDGEQSKFLNSFWTSNFLDNAEKTFFFKFDNNTLGYNNAVAHFGHGHSPNCTFCDINLNMDIHNETALHLF